MGFQRGFAPLAGGLGDSVPRSIGAKPRSSVHEKFFVKKFFLKVINGYRL